MRSNIQSVTSKHGSCGITATAAKIQPGSFDQTLNFSFDSVELTEQSRAALDKIAEGINDPRLENAVIIIIGHTDARGTIEYNQLLSERRAEAARSYLITQHGIDGRRLVAKGYGRSRLLLPSDPYNERNNRVQFQNRDYR
jgi:outer membrane protein OmpA-like peptidoglycan-associated protein